MPKRCLCSRWLQQHLNITPYFEDSDLKQRGEARRKHETVGQLRQDENIDLVSRKKARARFRIREAWSLI